MFLDPKNTPTVPQLCKNLELECKISVRKYITVKSTIQMKMFGTKISVCIALMVAYVDVMTHERCKARRYVGAGLGGCARSRLRMSMAASVLLLKEWYSRVQIP